MGGFPYVLLGGLVSLFGVVTYFAQVQKRQMSVGVDVLLASCLILFAGLRGASLDYEQYVIIFESVRDASSLPFLERALIGKDLLFGALLILIADSGLGVAFVFLCAAMLSVGLKVYAFRNAFGSSLLALFVLFCTYYFLHDFTQIRAAISIAFCFCAFVAVVHKQRPFYLAMCLLALGFHAQAALFIACTAPLFVDGRARFVLMAIASAILVVVTPILMSIVLEFDNRPGIAEAAEALSFNGMFSAFINLGLLSVVFFASRQQLRSTRERDLALAAIILVFSGFAFLIFTFSTSVVLAWRIAEMFMCFGVFVVVAALRGSTNPVVVISSIAYCLFNVVILMRNDLLVDYVFSEDFGACCAIF